MSLTKVYDYGILKFFQSSDIKTLTDETASLFNSTFLAGLQDSLSILVKQHSLTWIMLRPHEFATLAKQLSQTLTEISKEKATRAKDSQIQVAQTQTFK